MPILEDIMDHEGRLEGQLDSAGLKAAGLRLFEARSVEDLFAS